MTDTSPALLWFRDDLRLADNPALTQAAAGGRSVLPVFILDDKAAGAWAPGGAARWWLHHSLEALAAELDRRGLALILRRGDSLDALEDLVEASGAGAVFWNRRYEPWAIAQDRKVKAALEGRGLEVRCFNARLGFEPWEIEQRGGGPYKVYTPYSRAWLQNDPPRRPLSIPDRANRVDGIESGPLASLRLLPTTPDWAGGLRASWKAGEKAAQGRLGQFLRGRLLSYKKNRDFPGLDGVSFLSPHLRWGEISPNQIYYAAIERAVEEGGDPAKAMPFIRQVIWRDFAYHNLFHFPELPEKSLRAEFEAYPWAEDEAGLSAWQSGRTGFPIVDAGMRQLRHSGYMHNRVRMIVGSFLTKDLRIPWQAGAAWFWDNLVDADLANNSMGWQWVSGAGIDAAPYFRIFNPWTQSRKFDPDGTFIRRWLPELEKLNTDHVHAPAEAPAEVLEAAGIVLGRDYPKPLIDHQEARKAALEGYERIRRNAA